MRIVTVLIWEVEEGTWRKRGPLIGYIVKHYLKKKIILVNFMVSKGFEKRFSLDLIRLTPNSF